MKDKRFSYLESAVMAMLGLSIIGLCMVLVYSSVGV